MTIVDVKLKLSDELLAYLQQESKKPKVALDEVVSDVLADYFDEPSHEELLAGLQRSLKQVLGGDYRTARDFLDQLDSEEAQHDADSR